MYYIYHIPGVKIGCSTNPDNRVPEQGYTDWEILETHEDGWTAGDRELELQKEYGYKVDSSHYMITVGNRHKGFTDPSSAGKKGYIAAGLHTQKIKDKRYQKQKEYFDTVDWFERNKKVTDITMAKGNHPSQRVGTCNKCGREIVGAGPLGRHKKRCKG